MQDACWRAGSGGAGQCIETACSAFTECLLLKCDEKPAASCKTHAGVQGLRVLDNACETASEHALEHPDSPLDVWSIVERWA